MPSRPPALAILPPRLVLVLAGAATVSGAGATALERARTPNLAALAEGGHTGRLRAIAPHLPVTTASAHAALLGVVLPDGLDAAALAAASAQVRLGAGERATLVEVLDITGRPAPALHVARAAQVLGSRLPRHRVAAIHAGHQLLLVGPSALPELPEVDGLLLRASPPGHHPSPNALTAGTVAVAGERSGLLGVARLLGAEATPVPELGEAPLTPLRAAVARTLLAGAGTVVVECDLPLAARRRHAALGDPEPAAALALERIDRELLGPLRAVASWSGAAFIVTSDLLRDPDGRPVAGAVPIIVGAARAWARQPSPAAPAQRGLTPPPPASERGVMGRPIVTTPFALPPAQERGRPMRFARDPATGLTVPDPARVDG